MAYTSLIKNLGRAIQTNCSKTVGRELIKANLDHRKLSLIVPPKSNKNEHYRKVNLYNDNLFALDVLKWFPDGSTKRHSHDKDVVNFVVSGELLEVSNREYRTLNPGDYCFLKKKEEHIVYNIHEFKETYGFGKESISVSVSFDVPEMMDSCHFSKELSDLKYITQTKEICFEYLTKDGLNLKHVTNQTEEICLAAVNQNGLALKYVRDQTLMLCFTAVTNNPDAAKYIHKSENREYMKTCFGG
jgi:hypothetical protein